MYACGSEKKKGTKFLIIQRFLRSSMVNSASYLYLVPLTNRKAIRRVFQLRRKLKLQFGSSLADWRCSPVGNFHASVRKSYGKRRNYDYRSAKRGNKSEADRHKCTRHICMYSQLYIHAVLQQINKKVVGNADDCLSGRQVDQARLSSQKTMKQ